MENNEMTEIKIVELAANALGIEHPGGDHCAYMSAVWDCNRLKWWSPLRSDSDAMMLVVGLSMRIKHVEDNEETWCAAGGMGWSIVRWDGNKAGATRLAIVRAAAEVGKRMA